MKRIERMISNGGPEKSDYPELRQAINEVAYLSEADETKLMALLSPVLSIDTMQGHAYTKPHGYSGDFEIIDKIYTSWKSTSPALRKWDEFFHAQEAAIAVRNRKQYFIDLLTKMEHPTKVLNIGSGPARDIKEYFDLHPGSSTSFDCVDLDEKAIIYAKALCHEHIDKIDFTNKNIFRFKTEIKYDLIWSAGLFDYFSDKQFVALLRRLGQFLENDGAMVIGNFSTENPSRPYMESFGEWHLNHRSEKELIDLAVQAGADKDSVYVSAEEEGVNLFLHINK